MEIPESFRQIMKRNHITESQLIDMVKNAKEVAIKNLNNEGIYTSC